MHFYPHNIADFNNSTRHLTRVERSVYRDAIERYYDTEEPLTLDFDALAKRLLCFSDEEKNALKTILDEFFLKTEDGYLHERCESEIEKYRTNTSAKAKAGQASAEARRKKRTEREQNSTDVEQSVNEIQLNNNQEPITNNQDLNSCAKPSAPAPCVTLPLNDKTEFPIFDTQIAEWQELYPAADVRQELRNMRGWLIGNPTKRKTKSGILRFVTSWLAKEQNRGGLNGQAIGQTKPNAFDRTKQRIEKWERENGGIVLDGEVMGSDGGNVRAEV